MLKCILFFLIFINLEVYKSTLLKGKRALSGQFPWLIQFQTIIPCGGVLLSPDWVLTAAQCVQDQRNSIVVFATGLNGTDSKQTVYVKATYIYPRYDAYSVHHDRDNNIALLKLTRPFDTCNAQVTLPDIAPVRIDDNYKSCLIFGWQSYVSPSAKVSAKPIQYREVILNSWKLCSYMINGNASYENVFCTMAEFQGDMKACAGNPGSPVVCKNQYRKIVLLGIASWTNFCLDCGDLPTYLDVSVFRAWMHDLIFNHKKQEEWNIFGSSNMDPCKSVEIDTGNNQSNRTNPFRVYTQINTLSENAKLNLQNVSTLVVVGENFQQDSVATRNMSHHWNMLHSPLPDSDDYKKVSFTPAYYNVPYVEDVTKEQNNGLQEYQEIGKISSFHNADETVASSNEHKELNILEETSLYKTRLNKFSMERGDQIEHIDDLEFVFPFNFEDTTTSDSCANAYAKKLIVSYLIFVYLFYNIFYL